MKKLIVTVLSAAAIFGLVKNVDVNTNQPVRNSQETEIKLKNAKNETYGWVDTSVEFKLDYSGGSTEYEGYADFTIKIPKTGFYAFSITNRDIESYIDDLVEKNYVEKVANFHTPISGKNIYEFKNTNLSVNWSRYQFQEEDFSNWKFFNDPLPEFENGDVVKMTNVKSRTPISKLIEGITASDVVDGDLTSRIQIETDNYTPNIDTVGIYNVTLSVSDLSGNKAYLTIKIMVYEDKAPDITGVNEKYTVNYNFDGNFDKLFADLEITDDRTPAEELVISKDFSNYELNKNKVAEYTVSISATDTSNQTTIKTITIAQIDVDPPFFATDDSFIIIDKNVHLSEDDLFKILKAIGNISDDVVSYKVVENIDETTNGNYRVYFDLFDDAGDRIGSTSYVVQVGSGETKPDTTTDSTNSFTQDLKEFYNEYKTYVFIAGGILIFLVVISIVNRKPRPRRR